MVAQIEERLRENEPQRVLAALYGCSQAVISLIKRGQYYTKAPQHEHADNDRIRDLECPNCRRVSLVVDTDLLYGSTFEYCRHGCSAPRLLAGVNILH